MNNDVGETEMMEMKFGRRKANRRERPIIRVTRGEIGYTESYKLLGDQYDETGKNASKIKKKMEKRAI